jgi:hypothetical protein
LKKLLMALLLVGGVSILQVPFFLGSAHASSPFAPFISYSIIGPANGASPPVLTYLKNGTLTNSTLTTTSVQYLVDRFTTWSVSAQLGGSNGSIRWTTTQTSGVSGTVKSINIVYFSQVPVGLSYSIIGGANPTIIAVSGKSDGLSFGSNLNENQQTVWFDYGTTFTVPSIFQPFPGERWIAQGSTSGIAQSPSSMKFVYYHQYLVDAGYTVKGGGPGYAPSLTYESMGSSVSLQLQTTLQPLWIDGNSPYALTPALLGSGDSERWLTSPAKGIVSSAQTLDPIYFHQYLAMFTLQSVGSPVPAGSFLQATVNGSSVSLPVAGSITSWLDAGSRWSVTPLVSGAPGERWLGEGQFAGTVVGVVSVPLKYFHQYNVTVLIDPSSGGSSPVLSGWYDESSQVQLSASPYNGWKFIGWSGSGHGSYTGSNSSVGLVVEGVISERATFYVSVLLVSNDGGSIEYAVGPKVGVVRPGSSTTVYAPEGTSVTVKAVPSSLFFVFSKWGGSTSASTNPITFSAGSPVAVEADFSVNMILRLELAAIVVGVVGALAAYLAIRRQIPFAGVIKPLIKRLSRSPKVSG